MDGDGSRVPVLWDDRGEVAKAFDVGIFSHFCNSEGFQFRQSGHPVLEDVLSEGDRRFLYERVLLTARPMQAQRRVGTGGHVRLAPAVVTKVKYFLPLPRETALASCFTLSFLSTEWMNFTMQPKALNAKHAVIRPARLPSEQRGASSAKSKYSRCVAVPEPTNFSSTDASY